MDGDHKKGHAISMDIKRLIHWAKLFFTPFALVCLGYVGWQSRGIFTALLIDAQKERLILSILLWTLLHFFAPVFTLIIFKSSASSLNYKKIVLIHTLRLPAKYLPGGIWHTAAKAADYYQQGLSKRHIGFYLLLENIAAAAVTLALGGLIVMQLPENGQPWFVKSLILTITGTASAAILLLPWLFRRFILTPELIFSKSAYFFSIVCLIVYWLLVATSFVSFLSAFNELGLSVSYILAGGIYIFSWGVGFIALFAPQGIGVSEFISGQLLNADISKSSFIALLASFRLIIFIGDFLAWLIAVIISEFSSRRQ